MAEIPLFDEVKLRAICDILADTSRGLTNSEIQQLLRACTIADLGPTANKRSRLFEALSNRQQQDRCGNNVIAFIQTAMNPVRFVGRRNAFEQLRFDLNNVLGFAGYVVQEDGKLARVFATHTLTEAQLRANRLRTELESRRVHSDVLRFCRAELLVDDYFHAVFEAAKSVADKIRDKSGLSEDGGALVDKAFGARGTQPPLLVFNTWQTETERSEQSGLMNLMKGLFGAFRNTTAHAPRIKWIIKEQDALDMLTLASLVHRRLDDAVRTQ